MKFLLLLLVGCEPVPSPRDYRDDGVGPDGQPNTGRYHPVDYDVDGVHGPDLKLFTEDCRECHGANLDGGTADVSCDECHVEGWRTDCTYCHGGEDGDTSGAPGRDIDDSTTNLTFPPHRVHLDQDDHLALACETCHTVPDRALSVGHILDSTPARAEVTFSGRAQSVQYDGNGGCSNIACHGNGKPGSTASARADDEPFSCQTCHAYSGLSGKHQSDHDGYDCAECHADALGRDHISAPLRHVDGTTEFTSPDSLLFVSGGVGSYSCTGFCHNGGHFFESW